MTQPSYLPKVKEQYEDYPYPTRNPQDELQRLEASNSDCLDTLNHYGFGGRRNFHEDFRILSAGAGTGDSVIYLAEQLRGSKAEIVYLDLSSASMEIAKARAKVRGLDNITWIQGSLLDLPAMDIGKFDFINCTGVLHHLESPEAGLAALTSVLAEGGVMGLMLYGKYGRAAIYQTQDLLRMLAGEEDTQTRLDVCRKVINRLPKTNWLVHSHGWFGDLAAGDAGLYDLLLHNQDRAYSVPELYDYVENGGLKLVTFIASNICDPSLYVQDPVVLEKIKALPLRDQYAVGELLVGSVKMHTVYAAREIVPPPSPDDADMVPSLSITTDPALYAQLHQLVSQPENRMLNISSKDYRIELPITPALAAIVRQINGKTSLNNIYHKAMSESGLGRGELAIAFKSLYDAMYKTHFMYLRHKSVPYYLTVKEMQERFLQKKA